MGKVLYGSVKLKGSLASGAGDDLLTRDATSKEVGTITSGVTSLTNGYIFVGNASNIPTGVAVTGDIAITNTGVTSIVSGVIINADINASAAIALTKLAASTASRAIVTDGSGFLVPATTTATQIGYLSTTTSDVQVQLNSKQATITGAATTVTTSNLTGNRAVISNSSGKLAISSVTDTELGYLSGTSSSVQTQIDGKLSVTLTSPANGDIVRRSGGSWINYAAGSNGQVLTIVSGEPTWASGTSNGIPSGGTTNQYLRKDSNTNYDAVWDTLTLSKITDVTATAAQVNILTGTTVTATEFQFLSGATSNLQTQLSNKLNNSLSYNAIFVGNAANIPAQLAAGSNNSVLTIVGGVPTWQAPPTPGTFSGPASSTDNAIIRFNGTLGDAGQNSGVIIDDTNNITGITTLSSGQVSILNQAALRLYETGSTNYVALRASGTMTADYTVTLPDAAPGGNTYLKYDGANYIWAAGGAGATAFTGLTDVPVSYTGHALKVVRVNAGETALEFWAGGTGTVTNVTGTTDRITVATGTTTPVIDIASTYVGQTSITTVGTIATGTWNATAIGIAKGGTGNTVGAWGLSGSSTITTPTIIGDPYFQGNLLLASSGATITGSTRLDVRGFGTTSEIVLRLADSANTNRLLIRANGDTTLNSDATNFKDSTGAFDLLTIASSGAVSIPSGVFSSRTGITSSNQNVEWDTALPASTSVADCWTLTANGSFESAIDVTFIKLTPALIKSNAVSNSFGLISLNPIYDITGGTRVIRAIDYNPTETSLTGVTHYGVTVRSTGSLNGFGTGTPKSTLEANGSFGTKIQTVTTNTTLNATHSTILVDATSGNVTITLPTATSSTGRIYNIKLISATNQVTIDGDGSETIDGATTVVINTQYVSRTIQSNGTSWFII